jgi:hypothetical protein
MKYIIRANQGDYTSKLLLELQKLADVKILVASELKENLLENDKVYLSSDTIYPLIRERFDLQRRNIIDNFRNKYNFRKNLAHLYPDFFYDKTNLNDLINYKFRFAHNAKFIAKPMIGFMGAAARVIRKDSDLQKIVQEMKEELAKFAQLYPNIFSTDVVIEEYIEGGDEYAVDMYYDEQGEPIIINIYCHPQAKRQEYLQMLYYTNKKVFDQYYLLVKDFFHVFNKKINIRSFPIHAEFKLDLNKNLVPIEFNPCRFGGMGLADLTYYAFGFHPVKAFFDNFSPDWNSIWNQHPEENFCWILGYNTADLDIKNAVPNHNKFKEMLPKPSKLLAYEKLDHLKSPGFALAYLSFKQESGIEDILSIEFNDCFSKS